jgi:hypothetical protein
MYKRQGQNEREAALRVYFARRPQLDSLTLAAVLLAIGGLFLLLFLSSLTEDGSPFKLFIFPAILFGGCGWFLYSSIQSSFQKRLAEYQSLPSPPADIHVEAWLQEGVAKLTEHSRHALHLDASEGTFSEPLRILSPTLTQRTGVDPWDLDWLQGTDGKLRFGVYRATLIWLTDRHLASYTCFYDFIRDVPVNETATEIHYCDVVSFSTQETSSTRDTFSANLPTGRKATVQEELILSVASGGAIRVTLEEAYVKHITGAEELPESGAEKAVTVIRTMLRDKKRKELEARLSSAA